MKEMYSWVEAEEISVLDRTLSKCLSHAMFSVPYVDRWLEMLVQVNVVLLNKLTFDSKPTEKLKE